MNAKLTLTIDKGVIEEAKPYAKSEKRSLLNLIENYLKIVTAKEKNKMDDIHPKVAALRGSVKVPKDFSYDYKKEIQEAREEKYLKYLND